MQISLGFGDDESSYKLIRDSFCYIVEWLVPFERGFRDGDYAVGGGACKGER